MKLCKYFLFLFQGIKTLADVKEKAKLTHQQQIGLKYYDEFLERMPRDEAAEIVDTVRSVRTP